MTFCSFCADAQVLRNARNLEMYILKDHVLIRVTFNSGKLVFLL